MSETPSLCRFRRVSKWYGAVIALNDVSFALRPGITGLVGPNGAGKSTLIKLLTGQLRPSLGEVRVQDVSAWSAAARSYIGYCPDADAFYEEMSGRAFVRFMARLRGYRRNDAHERSEAALQQVEMTDRADRKLGSYSKGMRQRIKLAQAIVHEPELLILDEPTDGLDPNQKHEVRELLKEMSGKKAVIISTHILEEVEAVCSRAIVIAKGKMVADDNPLALQTRSRLHNAVGIRLPVAQAQACIELLNGLGGVHQVRTTLETATMVELLALSKDSSEILGSVHSAIDEKGIQVNEIYVERGRLEDVFRDLTFAVEGLQQDPDANTETSNA